MPMVRHTLPALAMQKNSLVSICIVYYQVSVMICHKEAPKDFADAIIEIDSY
jgi:hypothetical protein